MAEDGAGAPTPGPGRGEHHRFPALGAPLRVSSRGGVLGSRVRVSGLHLREGSRFVALCLCDLPLLLARLSMFAPGQLRLRQCGVPVRRGAFGVRKADGGRRSRWFSLSRALVPATIPTASRSVLLPLERVIVLHAVLMSVREVIPPIQEGPILALLYSTSPSAPPLGLLLGESILAHRLALPLAAPYASTPSWRNGMVHRSYQLDLTAGRAPPPGAAGISVVFPSLC